MRGVAVPGASECRVRSHPELHADSREALLPLPAQPTHGSTFFLDLSPKEHQQELSHVK